MLSINNNLDIYFLFNKIRYRLLLEQFITHIFR